MLYSTTTAARSILSRVAIKAVGRTTTKKYCTTTSSIQRLLSNQTQCLTTPSLLVVNRQLRCVSTSKLMVGGQPSIASSFSTASVDQQQKPNDILNETLEKARLYEQRSELIRRIKSDLIEADVNKDGRLDSDELKLILKKYSDTFTDSEINELGELFYLGKGGESISHERYVVVCCIHLCSFSLYAYISPFLISHTHIELKDFSRLFRLLIQE